MTDSEYLSKVLQTQNLSQDETDALVAQREEVEKLLRKELDRVSVTIRWAGSHSKETMNRSNYDADLVAYIHADEDGAGETLDEIYEKIESILKKEYSVERKTSAVRLLTTEGDYTHVDVVPGRYFDDSRTDTWLHRTDGDKCRFKTNLGVHLETIRGSGCRDLIRLIKHWANTNDIHCRTFILELMAIKLAKSSGSSNLIDRVVHVFEELRDNVSALTVEDPANPHGNDLSGDFDAVKPLLQFHARRALDSIDGGDWESVFGPVVDEGEKAAALRSVAVHVKSSSEPWAR